jgi:hypothetical protein
MKQSRKDDLIQAQMRPGVITRDGLLGDDTRALRDIIEADEAAVNRLGLSHAVLAARMRELRAAGVRGLGDPVTLDGTFEIRVDAVRGRLPCPFRHPGLYPNELMTVRNLKLGETVIFTRLNIHLIASHGFYEGLGSPYRLDPATLARVLGCG